MINQVTDSFQFDATDLRVLAKLQVDASLSNQDLAAAVHISPATCLRRVKRLEADGVIKGYAAVIDPAKIGRASCRERVFRVV